MLNQPRRLMIAPARRRPQTLVSQPKAIVADEGSLFPFERWRWARRHSFDDDVIVSAKASTTER